MTPNIKLLPSGEELREAMQFFLQNDVHYAPVVTPLGEVLGLLSEFGLIKASLRQYLDPEKHEKLAHHKGILEEAHFVEEGDNLDDVIKALMRSPNHRLLVKNTAGKLVGIISPKDILRVMSGEQKKFIDLRAELEAAKQQAEKLHNELSNLKENLDRYQTLYNETPHMMHSVDENGKIILANKKIHKTLGYEDGELIGKSLSDLYPQTVQTEALNGLKRIIHEGSHHTTYTSMVTKDGRKIRVDIASSSMKDRNGKFIGTITITREVDSEHLLRALHGVVAKHAEIPQVLKEELESEINDQITKTRKSG